MDLGLRGRTALVTGASKGIGATTAEVLAEEGCDLHLVARGRPGLDALAERLRRDHGVAVTVHAADLARTEDVEALARTVLGPNRDTDIDILVNNAGSIPAGSLDNLDEQAWRTGWDLKVFGYVNLTRLMYPRLAARGGGVIVNIIGSSGERGEADYIAGSTGNAALMSFTRTLGGRSLADGVRVVGINPGPVETERITAVMRAIARDRLGDEERYRELLAGFPMGRAARPREIADMVAFLASDRSAYTNGVVVTIDGGMSAA